MHHIINRTQRNLLQANNRLSIWIHHLLVINWLLLKGIVLPIQLQTHFSSTSGFKAADFDSSLQMLNQMVRVVFGTTCLRPSGSIDNPVVCFRFTGSCPASPFIYSMLDCGIWGEEHLWAIETKGAQDLMACATDIRLLLYRSPLSATRAVLTARNNC